MRHSLFALVFVLSAGCAHPEAHLTLLPTSLSAEYLAPVVCGPIGFRRAPLGARWGEWVRVTVSSATPLQGKVVVHAGGVAGPVRAWSSADGALVVEARFENRNPDHRAALTDERPIDLTVFDLEAPRGGRCEGARFVLEQGPLVPSIDERAWVAELERRGGATLAAERAAEAQGEVLASAADGPTFEVLGLGAGLQGAAKNVNGVDEGGEVAVPQVAWAAPAPQVAPVTGNGAMPGAGAPVAVTDVTVNGATGHGAPVVVAGASELDATGEGNLPPTAEWAQPFPLHLEAGAATVREVQLAESSSPVVTETVSVVDEWQPAPVAAVAPVPMASETGSGVTIAATVSEVQLAGSSSPVVTETVSRVDEWQPAPVAVVAPVPVSMQPCLACDVLSVVAKVLLALPPPQGGAVPAGAPAHGARPVQRR